MLKFNVLNNIPTEKLIHFLEIYDLLYDKAKNNINYYDSKNILFYSVCIFFIIILICFKIYKINNPNASKC